MISEVLHKPAEEIAVEKKHLKAVLVGNPNSGKSTLFNSLTGLTQKTGNFPGVTVEKRCGRYALNNGSEIEIVDLPGSYSLHPKSLDEKVLHSILCDPLHPDYPDVAIIVADASNLKRNLFLCTQVIDLDIPCVLALNMMDLAVDAFDIDTDNLSKELGIPVFPMNARTDEGVSELKKALEKKVSRPDRPITDAYSLSPLVIEQVKEIVNTKTNYLALHVAANCENIASVNRKAETVAGINAAIEQYAFTKGTVQAKETLLRYKHVAGIIRAAVTEKSLTQKKSFTDKADKILTHKVWGFVIFLTVLFFIFQAVFTLSAYPMEAIEWAFAAVSSWLSAHLPGGMLRDLLVNGIIAGIAGIVIFIPQIAFLFTFIAVLEDTGYMARVSFIMDKAMRKFGLNGKSIIPLISGAACAVPAIMSARTISNWKERLITIMVTPLVSCSARLPVFILLISLIIPADKTFGIFSYQGLALMILYLAGALAALAAAIVFRFFLKSKERSYFVMEMPVYRVPRWRSIVIEIYEKVKIFLFDVGKVIIAISIILWVLASFAPSGRLENIDKKYASETVSEKYNKDEIERRKAAEKLEASYAGMFGKAIEPAIAPLGFDWKIGISLITSFAAREVFVGTLATIYSVGDEENTDSIREKMMKEKNALTGKPLYSKAVGFSLLAFYLFALQCMSTIAIVYRETNHWKWPLIQFLYMGGMAWISSWLIYNFMK